MDPRTQRILELREQEQRPSEYRHPIIGISKRVQPHLEESERMEEPRYKYTCPKHGPHNGRVMGRYHAATCPKCVQEKAIQTRNLKLTAEEKARQHRESNNAWKERQRIREIEEIAGEPISALTVEPILTVEDFAEYPELLEQLRTYAREELRSVANQICYFVKIGMSRGRE